MGVSNRAIICLISALAVWVNFVNAQNSKDKQRLDELFKMAQKKYDQEQFKEAHTDYTNYLNGRPGDIPATFNRGLCSHGMRDYNAAILDFKKCTNIGAKAADVYYMIGESHFYMNDFKNAISNFDSVLKKKPDHLKALTNKGASLLFLSNHKEALIYLDKAVGQNKQYEPALRFRGLVKIYLRDFKGGLEDCSSALAIHKDYQTYFSIGLAQRELRNPDSAIVAFNEAIRLNPKFAKSYYNRGLSYNNKGRTDNALSDYNKCIELDPGNVSAIFNRAMLYFFAKEDYQKSEADFKTCVGLGRNDYITYCYLGASAFHLKKFDQATVDIEKAISIDSSFADGYYYRACIRFLAKADEASLADCKKYLRLSKKANPDEIKKTSFIYYTMGLMKSAGKNYKEAINDFSTSLDFVPGNAPALMERGMAYGMTEKDREALADLNEVIGKDVTNGKAFYYRAVIYMFMDDTRAACEDFSKAHLYGYDGALKKIQENCK